MKTGVPFITGKRIYLRPLLKSDINQMYLAWMNDPQITKYMQVGKYPQTLESLEKYYNDSIETRSRVLFAIAEKKTGRHIGNSSIFNIDWVNRVASKGNFIGDKTSYGKGYATEALGLLCEYAFDRLNLNKLYSIVAADNKGGIRINEKAGFVLEGTLRQHFFFDGRYMDGCFMSITRDVFEKRRRRKE